MLPVAAPDGIGPKRSAPAYPAALARDGRPGSVEVLSTRRDGEALLIHLRDASANPVPGTEPTYWRGLFAVNGRLVTVSVMSFADQPMGSDTGLGTLMGLVARCLLYTSPSPRDGLLSRMPSSA